MRISRGVLIYRGVLLRRVHLRLRHMRIHVRAGISVNCLRIFCVLLFLFVCVIRLLGHSEPSQRQRTAYQ